MLFRNFCARFAEVGLGGLFAIAFKHWNNGAHTRRPMLQSATTRDVPYGENTSENTLSAGVFRRPGAGR